MSSSLALALAAKACGGTVIAQVSQRVGRGTPPRPGGPDPGRAGRPRRARSAADDDDGSGA